MTDRIDLKHSKNNITKSFLIVAAEKALREAIDKRKKGFKNFSHWVLPDNSGYKLDNGKLIEVKKKKSDGDK